MHQQKEAGRQPAAGHWTLERRCPTQGVTLPDHPGHPNWTRAGQRVQLSRMLTQGERRELTRLCVSRGVGQGGELSLCQLDCLFALTCSQQLCLGRCLCDLVPYNCQP